MLIILLIIKSESSLSTLQRWLGAAFLWYAIINWNGIMESEKWLRVSEVIRLLLLIPFIFWVFNPTILSGLTAMILVTVTLNIIWVLKNFKTPVTAIN